MDGLLGGNQLGTLGLLGLSPEEINRARGQAQSDMYFALASQLLSGGPTGASIARGLQQGQQAYRNALTQQTDERLQQVKIQDYLRQQQEAQAARQRQQMVNETVARAIRPAQPAITTETPLLDIYGQQQMGPNMPQAAQPARFDLQSIIPDLLATPEGRKTLLELMQTEKAMAGELTTLAPEATLIRTNPLTGKTETVATGATKAPKLTDTEGNIAKLLYGTDDLDKIRAIPGAVDAIRKEATNQRLLSKPQINLSDPTAVQGQMLKTINQWEGLLNQNKTQEVADRANSFYNAYNLALKGNTNADGAMIYAVAKMYDPGGVVQAGDVSTIVGVRSIPSNIQLLAKKIAEGGTLLPKERENLRQIIDGIVDTKKKAIQPSLENYRKINVSLGGSPEAIVNPLDMIEKPQLDNILGGRR